MKRFVAILSALAMLCTVSCSEKKESAGKSDFKQNEARFTEDGKPIITIGVLHYIPSLFDDQFKKPKDIEVEFVDYTERVDKTDYDFYTVEDQAVYDAAVLREFEKDLIAGNIPDMLLIDTDQTQKYFRSGVLADLSEFMDKYDVLKREDFTECALEGLTINGEIPALMEHYYIDTAYAKTKYVGKEYENWTPGQAMEFFNDLPENMQFTRNYAEDDLLYYMTRCSWQSYVDPYAKKCTFDSGFADILDFCRDNPVIMDLSEEIIDYGREDTTLVHQICISGFDHALAEVTYGSAQGEDITFVGFPSEDGCGAYVTPMCLMNCITKSCSNPEAAWELVCKLVEYRKNRESYETGSIGIPILKKLLDKDYEQRDDFRYSINHQIYTNDPNEQFVITEEYKQMLRDYILSVPANPYINDPAEKIVQEECSAALDSRSSGKSIADILNKRISIILSEKE